MLVVHNQVLLRLLCAILGIVDSLERLVVHVEEAVRLGCTNDDPYLRLGLMMLDSAAEPCCTASATRASGGPGSTGN